MLVRMWPYRSGGARQQALPTGTTGTFVQICLLGESLDRSAQRSLFPALDVGSLLYFEEICVGQKIARR